MYLLLDIGNTHIKAAISNGKEIVEYEDFAILSDDTIKKKWLNADFKKVLVSCVNQKNFNKLKSTLKGFDVEFIDHQTSIPIINKYKTPQTLGIDRLMNVIAAKSLFPDENVIVIDAGTAIKFDYIDREGNYFGGAIAPGIKLRFLALHQFTDKLPEIKKEEIRLNENLKLVGDDTKTSMISGVVYGCIHEIESRISGINVFFENSQAILTGGDALFFAEKLKNPIFVRQNLTLIGLQEILKFGNDK